MSTDSSIGFFDTQFQRQVREQQFELNPFEQAALPHLHGRVLDFGCGIGNLAIRAARQGCSVLALDASPTAIDHIRQLARAENLPVEAAVADLRDYAVFGEFDSVVSIGLLMFFDCPTARRQLARLQERVSPGGVAAINVLIEGTSFLDMFDASGYCLFGRDELPQHFAGWQVLHYQHQDFTVPDGRIKSFATLIARKPA